MTIVSTDWDNFRVSLIIIDGSYFLKFYGILNKDGGEFHELNKEPILLRNFFKHLKYQAEDQCIDKNLEIEFRIVVKEKVRK